MLREGTSMGINNEPMIKQKDYSKEEYKRKKEKSYGVAKRIIIMFKLSHCFLTNTFVSLGLFILLIMGTGALPYLLKINIDFGANTFQFRGGLYTTLCCVFLVLFAISAFWYAIAYKKLEIMCIHLDGKLDGAFEVNENAQRDKLRNDLENGIGIMPTNYSSLSGPVGLAEKYLQKNKIKIMNERMINALNVVLIISQIIIAFLCILVLIK